jgi:hypothetical protein
MYFKNIFLVKKKNNNKNLNSTTEPYNIQERILKKTILKSYFKDNKHKFMYLINVHKMHKIIVINYFINIL